MARGMGLRVRIVASPGSTTEDEMRVSTVKVQIWPALPVRSVVWYESVTEMTPRVSMARPPSMGDESSSRPS